MERWSLYDNFGTCVKNVMDIQKEDEEQIANSAGGSSTTTSNALDDVLNQARAWIGISGSTNEATQYYGYNGVAWCCIFQWSLLRFPYCFRAASPPVAPLVFPSMDT